MRLFGFKIQESNRRLLSENKSLKKKIIELEFENDMLEQQLKSTKENMEDNLVPLKTNKPRINKPYKKYNIIGVKDNHFTYVNGKQTDYTVDTIKEVEENIRDYEAYPTLDSFNKLLPYSNSIRNRILWNIENGAYDKWIIEK